MEYHTLCQALREFTTGLLNQLLVNLSGQEGHTWLEEFKKFLRKESCWTNAQLQTGVPLDFVKPVSTGETLIGHSFVAKSRELAKEEGKETLGEAEYEFYRKPENWHLLPTDRNITMVVFCEAQFYSVSYGDHVRCLSRHGAGWRGHYYCLAYVFSDNCVAAVSQVGSKTSES